MKTLKKLLFLCFGIITSNTAQAQVEFNHSLGISALIAQTTAGWAFTYSPRLNLVPVGDGSNISLGTHLSANLSFSSRATSGNSFLFDFPIVAEYNSGFGASKDNDASFGFYGGLGYDLVSTMADDNGSNQTSGLLINGGVRFDLKAPLDLRVGYLLSSKSGDPNASNVLFLGISYMFGMSGK